MKRKGIYRRFILFAVIFIGLESTGMTYARWSDALQTKLSLSTGSMETAFSEKTSCYMSLVDEDGNTIFERRELDAVLKNQGKEISVTADLPIFSEEFLARQDSLVKLEFPIQAGVDGTIETVEALRVDFSQETQEETFAQVDRISLVRENSGEVYPISRDEVAPFDKGLGFYVFRETAGMDGDVTAIIYLKLQEESRSRLAELPSRLFLDRSEEVSDFFQGSLMVSYDFSLPIYVEQGHENSIFLEEVE